MSSLDPLLCPVGLLLSTPSCRVELRYLIILLLLLLTRADLLCLSHRFPVSHVRERETGRSAVAWRLFVVRERKAEQEEGRGGTWGGASKCVSAWSVTAGSPGATSPAGCAPRCEEGGGEHGLYRDCGERRGGRLGRAAQGQLRPRVTRTRILTH